MSGAFVIGSGPAGLMAAQELAQAGVQTTLVEAKPSFGRKFLMAGKSGLNLTKDEPLDTFLMHYAEASDWLSPILSNFGPTDAQDFALGLEQEIFTGSSGRVFPTAMKASPLLRAWLGRLNTLGVKMQTRWRWIGWDGDALAFETADGIVLEQPRAVVFALGGASWARLGSDGHWAELFAKQGIPCTPFGAANAALSVEWSPHMSPYLGMPLKAVQFSAGGLSSRGEAMISAKGLEGGGVYSISRTVRQGAALTLDLRPDWAINKITTALERPRGKASLSSHLRKTLKLSKLEQALLNEWARPLPQDPQSLARLIKALPLRHAGLRPIDEAISTSGGVARAALDDTLMLNAKPGQFCAGEMLDWEAPTGGYLITACLATGWHAGRSAARYIGAMPASSPA